MVAAGAGGSAAMGFRQHGPRRSRGFSPMRFFGTPPIDGAFCEYVAVHEQTAGTREPGSVKVIAQPGR